MRLRDKQHYLSSSRTPTLLNVSETLKNKSVIGNYIVPYEQTIVIRCADLQLTDQLLVQFFDKRIFKKKRGKSLSVCYLSLGDIYTFMNNFYQEQLRNQTTAITNGYRNQFQHEENQGINDNSLAIPCFQEFAMMKSTRRKNKRKSQTGDILRKISDEMLNIEEENRKEMEYMESNSFSESEDSFDVTNGKAKEGTSRTIKASDFEQLHGHLSLSFFPILW